MNDTVEYSCLVCKEFTHVDLAPVVEHLTQAHGYTREQVGKAQGGLRMALDGAEGYSNVYAWAVDGMDLVGRVTTGEREPDSPWRFMEDEE